MTITLPYPTEAALVTAITKTLESLGYLVGRIGQQRAQGSGTTVGMPDLAVRHPSWQVGRVVMLEVKNGDKGRLSTAQQEMEALGWMHVVRSVEDALHAVRWHEADDTRRVRLVRVIQQLGGEPC